MALLDAFFGNHREGRSPESEAAIAWAVERVEPMLKWAGGYPDRYRKPVAHALDYARALAARVPGPLVIGAESYVTDPLVHALFVSPDKLCLAVDASRAMKAFFQAHPDAAEVYAMVAVRRMAKARFGLEMDGEILRRDVRQEVVYFTDHTVAEPGLTEAEARQRIARGLFESLIGHVAKRIEARKQGKQALEQERDELLGRLRTATAEQRGELEQTLQSTLARLAESVASLDLGRYPEDFDAVLLEPEKYLFLEQTEINLDSMGIIRQPEAAGSNEVVFCDLIGRDRRRWTVTLIYCDHVKNRGSITDRLANAQRWLGL